MSKTIFSQNWENASTAEKQKIIEQELSGLRPAIIYVDDDNKALEIFKFNSEKFGFDTFEFADPIIALDFIGKNKSRVLLVISDFKMSPFDGFEFRKKILDQVGEVPFAILSGVVDAEMAKKGDELKVNAFFEKPFRTQDFLNFLKKDGELRVETLKEEYEMLKGFTDDASNLLENIEELCLDLENNPQNQDAIARIFGSIHTIKGSSGFFEPRDLHTFSHSFEDLLKDVQSGKRAVTPQLVSIFLKGNDVLKTLVNEFKTGVHSSHDIPQLSSMFKNIPEELSSSAPTHQADVIQDMGSGPKEQKASELRVSMTLLNEFMQISGEMTVIRNMINKTVRNLEKQYQGDKEIGLLSELLDEMHKINGDVQSKITDIRRVPVSSLVKPLSRTVRDTARALNKDIEFTVEGDDLRLDNSIAEVLTKSLVHMVRNSIDHGIESPEKRQASGKNPKGKLLLKFSSQGENILVDIQDDGGGINVEKVREKVISKGLKSPALAEKMTNDELHYMIFDSGFSTAEHVTDFSGRGVGMSMVKDSVESMKGRIIIQSTPGKGSKFRLEIPIPKSVLITNCLFVCVGGRSYGIPQDNILKVMEKGQLSASDYSILEGAEVIRFNNGLIPLCSISKLMGIEGRERNEGLIVIMKTENSIFALRVESVMDIEDAVIKPLSFNLLKGLEIYLGGTFLADGSVGLVFNVEGVAKRIGIHNSHFSKNKKSPETNSPVEILEKRNVIVFNLQKPGQFCLEEKDILRIERLDVDLLQKSGESYVVPYRDSIMSLIDLDQMICPKSSQTILNGSDSKSLATVIIKHQGQFLGFVVKEIVDLKTALGPIEKNIKKQYGISGCFTIDEHVVSLVSLSDILSDTSYEENFDFDKRGEIAA
jgi:two-component system chemotaxis sensor kinase CheA